MIQRSLLQTLSFTIVVVLAAQTLDILTHLATGVVVHFSYITAKTIVLGFATFFFSYWVGIDWKHGIFGVFIATAMFYIYYLFTEPTLDRTVFTVDEQALWILIHFVAVYIPYILTVRILERHE